jgi:toxin YoeB
MLKPWHDTAWDDYLWWQTQDRKTLKRVNRLVFQIKGETLEICACRGHHG